MTASPDPPPRTPLRTEVKWGLGILLVSTVVAVAGFALFMTRLLAL